jgi:hypothetical protein
MRKPKSFSLSRVTCVCCRKETTVNQIDRHFDNCKNKKAP